eukprot:COSAG01_NODE_11014_length_2026_cov_14.677218_2_plen_242_part_00
MYYPFFGVIDRANRYRQHLLKIEFAWKSEGFRKHYLRFFEGINIVDAYLAQKYFQPTRHACFEDALTELIHDLLPTQPAIVSPIRDTTSTSISMTAAAGHRRSPRSMNLHVPEEMEEQVPRPRAKGVRGGGTRVYRRKHQELCRVCGLYKTTIRCKVCKVPICAHAACNPGVDLAVRDCWARHQLYGLPGKYESKKDWRGPWWTGYKDHQEQKRKAAANRNVASKRLRASTGTSLPRHSGL